MTATIEDLDLDLLWNIAVPCESPCHDHTGGDEPATFMFIWDHCPGHRMTRAIKILICINCKRHIQVKPKVQCSFCNCVADQADFRFKFIPL